MDCYRISSWHYFLLWVRHAWKSKASHPRKEDSHHRKVLRRSYDLSFMPSSHLLRRTFALQKVRWRNQGGARQMHSQYFQPKERRWTWRRICAPYAITSWWVCVTGMRTNGSTLLVLRNSSNVSHMNRWCGKKWPYLTTRKEIMMFTRQKGHSGDIIKHWVLCLKCYRMFCCNDNPYLHFRVGNWNYYCHKQCPPSKEISDIQLLGDKKWYFHFKRTPSHTTPFIIDTMVTLRHKILLIKHGLSLIYSRTMNLIIETVTKYGK